MSVSEQTNTALGATPSAASTGSGSGLPVLSVRDLVVEFDTREGVVKAVNGISFDVYPGETLGIVGESGSGKSVSTMAVMGLVTHTTGRVVSGEVFLDGRDILRLSRREFRKVQSGALSMVFQDPMTSLNPVLTVGEQIAEAVRGKYPQLSRAEVRARCVELLERVGVPNPAMRVKQYPHQFSGGMRQRAMIAMAIANDPRVLIADEPTTALDVTIQAQVLETLKRAQQETHAPLVIITHDLALMAEMADRILVMYAGRIVESGTVQEIFANPRHPYTVGLLSSIPRIDTNLERLVPIEGQPPSAITPPMGCAFHPRCTLYRGRARCHEEVPQRIEVSAGHTSACHFSAEVPQHFEIVRESLGLVPAPLSSSVRPDAVEQNATNRRRLSVSETEVLRVESLCTHFPIKSPVLGRRVGAIRAVDGVSFTLHAGETLGLVGESGCGKSTTGKTIMGLIPATDGRVVVNGRDTLQLGRADMRRIRRDMQIVFQDPFSSLDPRMTVYDLIAEPLRIHNLFRELDGRRRVPELMELVGLNPEHRGRYAHEFSGGQRQRIGIARALALRPRMLILDEPVSSLDVSIQAQVINLLMELQEELGLAYLFIAHDLAVVRQISHRVAVMYLGKIVEIGERDEIYNNPTHPYTQSLLSAVPIPDPALRDRANKRIVLKGDVPNPASPPIGCNFQTRCFKRDVEVCAVEPDLADGAHAGHPCACHFAEVGISVATRSGQR